MVGLGISVEATIIGHVPEAMIADHERTVQKLLHTLKLPVRVVSCAACRRARR